MQSQAPQLAAALEHALLKYLSTVNKNPLKSVAFRSQSSGAVSVHEVYTTEQMDALRTQSTQLSAPTCRFPAPHAEQTDEPAADTVPGAQPRQRRAAERLGDRDAARGEAPR